MIESGNSRLNITFTLWFLAVAIIPSLFVGVFAYNLLKSQTLQLKQDELAIVTRLKIDRLQQHVKSHLLAAESIAQTYDSVNVFPVDDDQRLPTVLDLIRRDRNVNIFFVDYRGMVSPATSREVPSFIWLQDADRRASHIKIIDQTLVTAYPLTRANTWLVMVDQPTRLQELLHESINDAKYFSSTEGSNAQDDVGKSADLFLLDADGVIVSNALLLNVEQEGSALTGPLASWTQSQGGSSITSEARISGRDVLMHAEKALVGDQSYTFVMTIDRDEVLSRLLDHQRNLILTYIFATIAILSILYIFVRYVSRSVIRPIMMTISDLVKSSGKIKQSIDATETVMATQEKVAESLSKNYKKQQRNIKAVHGEISEIVAALTNVTKQTKAASRSVQLIDDLAAKSQDQAKEARSSINSIKRLATAHDVLLATLQHYSTEVDRIAADVRRLSQATKYLSLNATIEANKSEKGSHSVSSIVSQVGRLSVLSKTASERINELVQSIQIQLRKSKDSAGHELHEASTSLTVINKALESLNRMSRDIMKISSGVRVIDEQVRKQSQSTHEIVVHAGDLTEQARGTMRDANKVASLTTQQKGSVRANSTAVRKLLSIIQQLSQMIGTRKKK